MMSCKLRHNFSYNQIKLIYYFAAFLVFLTGIVIYTFFRNHNILLFQIFPKPVFLDMLHFPVRANGVWMSMLLFNLPDGLWFLSGLLVIRAVWLANPKWNAIYFYVFVLIALVMEISQISDNFPGTFDFLDIVFMAFFAFTESIIFNLFVN